MIGDTVLPNLCPYCGRKHMTWEHIRACKKFQELQSALIPKGAKVTIRILKGRDADYYSDK